jgi:hypothetical protein
MVFLYQQLGAATHKQQISQALQELMTIDPYRKNYYLYLESKE